MSEPSEPFEPAGDYLRRIYLKLRLEREAVWGVDTPWMTWQRQMRDHEFIYGKEAA